MLIIAIVVAIIAAAISLRSEIVTGISAVDLFLGETRARIISAVVVAMLGTIGFLNLSTEQEHAPSSSSPWRSPQLLR